MEFAGIIAEYDPFHNGHAQQLRMLRAAGVETIAVCMSNGAVQRGGFPLLPGPVRVRAALQAGADIVVALPAPYACLGAEGFAAAGVALLTALGCDVLAFGAEDPDADRLMQAAQLVDSKETVPFAAPFSGSGKTVRRGAGSGGRGSATRHGTAAQPAKQYSWCGILQGNSSPGQPHAAVPAAASGRRTQHRADRYSAGQKGGIRQLSPGTGPGAPGWNLRLSMFPARRQNSTVPQRNAGNCWTRTSFRLRC